MKLKTFKACLSSLKLLEVYSASEEIKDFNQGIRFAFLRDTLVELNLVPEVGDIIEYNNEYYEVDSLINNNMN
jgi:hypothetical protein